MKRTLAEIANLINGKLCGDYDENLVITGATGIALAGPSEITFAVDPHLEEAIACNAAAVIIQEDVDGFSKTCIKVKNPREAFNILLNIFYFSYFPRPQTTYPTALTVFSALW